MEIFRRSEWMVKKGVKALKASALNGKKTSNEIDVKTNEIINCHKLIPKLLDSEFSLDSFLVSPTLLSDS